jgi:hypothetical protein
MRYANKNWAGLMVGAALLAGCQLDALTREEAQDSLDESSVDSQASALTAASVEISTDFTIGEAADRAAEKIQKFVKSQLPCAEITLTDATLTIEYGALPGSCTYRGHNFSGLHEIQVERNMESDVIVHHRWDELSNGRISVTGEATVTWTKADPSRRIEHELTWTRLEDGRTGTGSGDRIQKPLAGGIAEGISVDGVRAWDGKRGHWDLDINNIEMRWNDPVPQSGSWVLVTPKDKTITLEFERIDEDSIAVTASGGQRNIDLKINKLGAITRR